MNIEIEVIPFNTSEYYAGVYTDEVEKEYEFSYISKSYNNIETNFSIVWLDGIPDNNEEIEQKINDFYNER